METESSTISQFKGIVMGIAIGILIGAGMTFLLTHWNPKDEASQVEILAASSVFERYIEQNEMVTTSQRYNITEKAGTTSKIPFTDIEIPFTANSFWYRYVGTIKAGVDLSNAELSQDEYAITVEMDQPHIISNTPDRDQSGVLEENNNILNPIRIEDVDAFFRQCAETSEQESIEGGLLDEARAGAETNLQTLFAAALGDEYTVSVKWREG